MNNIREIKTKKFNWLSVVKATHEDLKYLKNEYGFEASDLSDCLPTKQRPKIIRREDYLFLVLQFPYYNRETRTIESSEIDIFLAKKYLITVHEDELEPLNDYFNLCQTDQLVMSQIDNQEILELFQTILFRLYKYCYPILNHLNLDIDQIEKDILGRAEEETIKNILLIKRNIVNFQKSMQAHKSILEKLIDYSEGWRAKKLDHEYFNLISLTKDIWDNLVNYKDTINALHETQESMTSLKINEIMKTLTIFSVIVFPLTLLAAIFGMNTMNAMPFVDSPYDFWFIIGCMALGVITMLGYFKWRKWI